MTKKEYKELSRGPEIIVKSDIEGNMYYMQDDICIAEYNARTRMFYPHYERLHEKPVEEKPREDSSAKIAKIQEILQSDMPNDCAIWEIIKVLDLEDK